MPKPAEPPGPWKEAKQITHYPCCSVHLWLVNGFKASLPGLLKFQDSILSPDKTRVFAGTPVSSLLRRFECVDTVRKVANQRTLLKHILPSFKIRTEFLAGVGYYYGR